MSTPQEFSITNTLKGRMLADARGIKPGVLIHATRVAVTGQGNSPGIFEVLVLLGQARTVDRIRTLAAY